MKTPKHTVMGGKSDHAVIGEVNDCTEVGRARGPTNMARRQTEEPIGEKLLQALR